MFKVQNGGSSQKGNFSHVKIMWHLTVGDAFKFTLPVRLYKILPSAAMENVHGDGLDKVLPREVDLHLHLKAEVEGGIVDMTISDNL